MLILPLTSFSKILCPKADFVLQSFKDKKKLFKMMVKKIKNSEVSIWRSISSKQVQGPSLTLSNILTSTSLFHDFSGSCTVNIFINLLCSLGVSYFYILVEMQSIHRLLV